MRDIEQRIKSEIESDIAALKAAGHNLGTNAAAVILEKMWAYFHGDHAKFEPAPEVQNKTPEPQMSDVEAALEEDAAREQKAEPVVA